MIAADAAVVLVGLIVLLLFFNRLRELEKQIASGNGEQGEKRTILEELELFNELMEIYRNPVRAVPDGYISDTLREALEVAKQTTNTEKEQ